MKCTPELFFVVCQLLAEIRAYDGMTHNINDIINAYNIIGWVGNCSMQFRTAVEIYTVSEVNILHQFAGAEN